MIKTLALTILILTSTPMWACSVVCETDSNETSVGYSMEWFGRIALSKNPKSAKTSNDLTPYEGGGMFLIPAGIKKQSLLGGDSHKWTSKYASLVLGTFGPELPFNGINEKGLEIYLLGTPTPVRDNRKLPTISEADILPLLLDTAATTNEALSILKSVAIYHYMFPLHVFIKDTSGKVAIVDYKKSLRIHLPKNHEAILTNGFYDTELALRRSGTKTYLDDRHFDIRQWLHQNPMDLDGALSNVGDSERTLWRTQTVRAGDSTKLIVKINPLSIKSSNRRAIQFDLTQVFHKNNLPEATQVILFSEVSKNGNRWRTLSPDELRMIKLSNFQVIKENQDAALGRNEDRYYESVLRLDSILAGLKK